MASNIRTDAGFDQFVYGNLNCLTALFAFKLNGEGALVLHKESKVVLNDSKLMHFDLSFLFCGLVIVLYRDFPVGFKLMVGWGGFVRFSFRPSAYPLC